MALHLVALVLSLPGGPRLVEEANGIDAIESLHFHPNEALAIKSRSLVDQYFGDDYDTEDVDQTGASSSSSLKLEYPTWRKTA